jgi:hypothetical protein
MQNNVLVKKVSEILWANERRLSDGFEFYEGGYPEAVEAVNEISEQIVRLLTLRAVDFACSCAEGAWLPIGGNCCERCGGLVPQSH